ncbi:hypothetical protein CALVIDRAFT_568660 [Calocera viscosa TUFC12733]|uniref:Uncharacterized protein n=1 Tax=Calocera viscosa (strain TUFC12733) TaxID=1330018 RepID=A0A167GT32_CALVF|nr:hypothetical protein CALVIDRAFT_568660 [Calocera viscosa TUFC12733]
MKLRDAEASFILDARIRRWYEEIFPKTLGFGNQELSLVQRRQMTVVRFHHLRLLVRRWQMVSLTYDSVTGRVSGDLAVQVVNQLATHKDEINLKSAFRFHMAACLGGATLILATLLVRPLSEVGLQDVETLYQQSFTQAVGMLRVIVANFQPAYRIATGLAPHPNNMATMLETLLAYPHLNFEPSLGVDVDDSTGMNSLDLLSWLSRDGSE